MTHAKMTFIVIDPNTGKPADLTKLARAEGWLDMVTDCADPQYIADCRFALGQDNEVYVVDDDGNSAKAPPGRFEVRWKLPEGMMTEEEWEKDKKRLTSLIGEVDNGSVDEAGDMVSYDMPELIKRSTDFAPPSRGRSTMSDYGDLCKELRSEKQARNAERHRKATDDYVPARSLAEDHHWTLRNHDGQHFALLGPGWILNLWPSSGRWQYDPNHRGPPLHIPKSWTLLDVVHAAVDAEKERT